MGYASRSLAGSRWYPNHPTDTARQPKTSLAKPTRKVKRFFHAAPATAAVGLTRRGYFAAPPTHPTHPHRTKQVSHN